MSKIYTWTPATPLGLMNNELDALHAHVIDRIWLGVGDFIWQSTISPAISEVAGYGSRIGAYRIPDNGTVNVYLFTSLTPPQEWRDAGKKLSVKIYWSPNAATPANTLRLGWGCWQWDVGTVGTSPDNTVGNVDLDVDLTGYVTNQLYTNTLTATSSTFDDHPLTGFRVGRVSAHANDTYTGTIDIFGVELTLV